MKLKHVKDCLNSMPLYWKVYIFIVVLLIFVIGMVELVLEPFAERMFEALYGGFQSWHEVAMWTVSILIPSLACGYVLSKILSVKLEKMVKASKALAGGNLEVRLPVKGNDKDAFDVLAHSFNEMARAIKTQQQNERRLLADLSHELRSPLTRMTVATELLGRRHKDKESITILLRLEKELAQMNEMVSLLLRQTRDNFLASGNNEMVEINKIIEELTEDFVFQGEIENKKIKSNIIHRLNVYGNSKQLECMFSNVLSNAIFYSPPNSLIHLNTRLDDGLIHISIRDYGPGVPEDQLEDIFRAFYRVDSSRTRTSGGVGLGLAVAREAAILHGGNIVARNADPGLQVTITLPLYDGQIG
jgi:two-component system sensor histidine kinase CpxA